MTHTQWVGYIGFMFNTELVDEYMMQHRLTWADFCKKANIRMVDLKKFMSNDGGIRLDQFLSIAETLGVSAGLLIL